MLIGPSASGKTSLLERLTKGTYDDTPGHVATLKYKDTFLTFKTSEDEDINFKVRDFPGNEVIRKSNPEHYGTPDGVIVVFDGNSEDSRITAFKMIKEFKESFPEVPVVTVCNKTDLGTAIISDLSLIPRFATAPISASITVKRNVDTATPFLYLIQKIRKDSKKDFNFDFVPTAYTDESDNEDESDNDEPSEQAVKDLRDAIQKFADLQVGKSKSEIAKWIIRDTLYLLV